MYLHTPIEFRLTRYRPEDVTPLIPGVYRKKPVPSVHKVGPDRSTPRPQQPIEKMPAIDTEKLREQYRREHDRLEHMEVHRPYQEIRRHWDLQQLTEGLKTLHIGVAHDGSDDAIHALHTAEFLAKHYHGTAAPIDISTETDPGERLVTLSHERHFTLLIMTSGNIQALQRVLTETTIPVLVQHGIRPMERVQKILVPYDGSPFSYPAIAQGIVLCEDMGAELFVLHVSTAVESREVEHGHMTELLSQMAWHEVQHDSVTMVGDVADSLVKFCALSSIDLIIMGTHGLRKGRESFALALTGRAPCPVWILHPYQEPVS